MLVNKHILTVQSNITGLQKLMGNQLIISKTYD